MEYDYLLNVCLDQDYKEVTSHSYEYTTRSMLILPHIPPHLYTYHPFNKYPLTPAWKSKDLKGELSLSHKKKSEKNQLSSMVLQRFRCHSGAKRLCSFGCGYYARSNEYLSSMESFWYQFECRRCLWRDCGFEGEIRTESLVAAQIFEYKMSNILDKPLCVLFLVSFFGVLI